MGLKVTTKDQNDSFAQNHADKQGEIHKEFMPEWQAVNSEFYAEVIGRFLKHISGMRLQFWAEGSSFLLHDNAPSHFALVKKIFLNKHGVMERSHPPSSPDLASVEFFFLSQWKFPSKERGFTVLTLRKSWLPNWTLIFGDLSRPLSKNFQTIQQINSSSRRLLSIEILQFLFSSILYFFRHTIPGTLNARPHRPSYLMVSNSDLHSGYFTITRSFMISYSPSR